ncbi:EcsC family protein [uncultured Enterovirga sp.]|uniref:EcsC family protein n=1 Tax=uncultured Enterovirga sp. TaxID=2026352 RepID=UPI0035CA03D8
MTTELSLNAPPETHDLAPAGTATLSETDLAALRIAVAALERSTLAGRLSGMVGKPLEMIGHALPAAARDIVTAAVSRALRTALKVALTTLPKAASSRPGGGRMHTALAAASGAIGGALGLMTLPVELPVSTTLILRAIADIARSEGEDLADPEAALACLQVFALGSRTEADDLASSGYFAVRGALAKSITEAARVAAGRGFTDRGAPALVRFMAQIASRFGIVVSQKVAAGAVPVVGAIGGAAVNAAFMEHFRTVARAHFTVRRLERSYGAPAVRQAYEAIRTAMAA